MSEQDNVAIIRNVYKAFGEGDLETILVHIDDNADWINYGPSTVPYAGTRSGRAEVSEFFQAIALSTTDGKVMVESFVAQGDVVVALGRYTAVVRSTGAPIDSPIAHVFTLRDGKVTRWTGYSDSAHVAAAHTGASAAAA